MTVLNGDPMHEVCILNRIPRAHGNSEGVIGLRSGYQNNSRRVVNIWKEGKCTNEEESPKQGLIIVKDLTQMIPRGGEGAPPTNNI